MYAFLIPVWGSKRKSGGNSWFGMYPISKLKRKKVLDGMSTALCAYSDTAGLPILQIGTKVL